MEKKTYLDVDVRLQEGGERVEHVGRPQFAYVFLLDHIRRGTENEDLFLLSLTMTLFIVQEASYGGSCPLWGLVEVFSTSNTFGYSK